MKAVFDPYYELRYWFDSSAEISGWFDQELADSAAGGPVVVQAEGNAAGTSSVLGEAANIGTPAVQPFVFASAGNWDWLVADMPTPRLHARVVGAVGHAAGSGQVHGHGAAVRIAETKALCEGIARRLAWRSGSGRVLEATPGQIGTSGAGEWIACVLAGSNGDAAGRGESQFRGDYTRVKTAAGMARGEGTTDARADSYLSARARLRLAEDEDLLLAA